MRDDLGDRMKREYESRTRYLLPRRTWTLIRIDGKGFHNYTRNCARPYDLDLMADMDATAKALCEKIDGARLAFVQSDEISLLLTDFGSVHSEAWFDGSLQKICSVSASIATAHFNRARESRGQGQEDPAYFDSRVWTISTHAEVCNYFIWRQQDASRNSVTMTARAYISHAEVDGISGEQMQEMLWQRHGVNWNDLPPGFKRGRVIERVADIRDVTYRDKRSGETRTAEGVTRHEWRATDPPIFTQDRDWLSARIPDL